MDQVVLDALRRCEMFFREATHVELSPDGWQTVEFDEAGKPIPSDKSILISTGPMWSGSPGTHPLLSVVREAISHCESVP